MSCKQEQSFRAKNQITQTSCFEAKLLKMHISAGRCWHTPLIPALGRQRQADFWVQSQPGLQSEFQDRQGYTEKPCLEKKKTKKKKKKKKKEWTSARVWLSIRWDSVDFSNHSWVTVTPYVKMTKSKMVSCKNTYFLTSANTLKYMQSIKPVFR